MVALEEKSSLPVAEQCAWALGNVAGEREELRSVLLAVGAPLPLARLMLSNKSSTARTAAWALSNMIKLLFGIRKCCNSNCRVCGVHFADSLAMRNCV